MTTIKNFVKLSFIHNLLLLLIALPQGLFAQASICGTVPPTATVYPPPQNYNGAMVDCYPDIPGPYFIRIAAHIIRSDNGTGGIPLPAVNAAIEQMTVDFEDHNIFFVWDECADEIADDDLYTATSPPPLLTLKSLYGSPNVIDMFFFPEYDNFSPNGQGLMKGSVLQIGGVIKTWNGIDFPVIETHSLSHEMGHCLGLYHTFESLPDPYPNNDINCCVFPAQELVDGSNGCECGDQVKDTPGFSLLSQNGSLLLPATSRQR